MSSSRNKHCKPLRFPMPRGLCIGGARMKEVSRCVLSMIRLVLVWEKTDGKKAAEFEAVGEKISNACAILTPAARSTWTGDDSTLLL